MMIEDSTWHFRLSMSLNPIAWRLNPGTTPQSREQIEITLSHDFSWRPLWRTAGRKGCTAITTILSLDSRWVDPSEERCTDGFVTLSFWKLIVAPVPSYASGSDSRGASYHARCKFSKRSGNARKRERKREREDEFSCRTRSIVFLRDEFSTCEPSHATVFRSSIYISPSIFCQRVRCRV